MSQTHHLTLAVNRQGGSYDHLIRRIYRPEDNERELFDTKSLFKVDRGLEHDSQKNPFSFTPNPGDLIHYDIRLGEVHDDGKRKYRLVFDGIYFFRDAYQIVAYPYRKDEAFTRIETSPGIIQGETSIHAGPNQNLNDVTIKLFCSEQLSDAFYYTLRFEAINLTLHGPGYGATLGTLDIDPEIKKQPQPTG